VKLSNTFTRYNEEKQKNQDALLQAKQEAEAANQAKSDFLANMSHDLRAPLNGIVGMLQLLDRAHVNSEQQGYVRIALKSSRRLTELLSDILDISRVEAGKMPLRYEPFDLTRVIKHVCDLFSITFQQNNVSLTYEIHPAIHTMLIGDSARLQQILSNLLGNSSKFTKTGSVQLEVYPLPAVTSSENRILFTVVDTGEGIPANEIEHLFEPFTQAGHEWRKNSQGSGLGLAICKRLVKLMGGNIYVESELGIGTTVSFCVSFDRCKAESKKKDIPQTENAIEFRALNILVAEDDTISATTVKWLLEKCGCTVTTVGNGAEALETLKKNHFHAVLMDIQMPIMGGLETVQAIRRNEAGEKNKDIPVIALTAFAMEGDKDHFIEKGMDGYLSKPVDMTELHAVLQKVVSLRHQTSLFQ
jgi:CheY-like chemotaxis protein